MGFKKMLHLHVFTDGSVNTLSKVGYGAYFVVSDLNVSTDLLTEKVKVKRFEQTSSTTLELQTLLWALDDAMTLERPLAKRRDIVVTAYTDSQNIISLPGRRARLERQDFLSSKKKRLNNSQLYQEFYRLTSIVNCEFVKVVGHQASHKKGKVDRLFALVDKASRRALRESKVLP
ncbi:MAG: ribonuclease HI [Cellvibrionaceae bacterium]|jgi:ribonuclease HI